MPIPFQPTLPSPACFDAARNAWILSRHADVSAALREPSLGQAGTRNGLTAPNGGAHYARQYADAQADMARMSTATWRRNMAETLSSRLRQARWRRRIDLVRDIIHPWATTMLVTLNGGEAIYSRRLAQICEILFYGPTTDARLRQDSAGKPALSSSVYEQELDRMLDGRQLLLSKPMFYGLTQTMPSFLAKAWLALMKYPDQIAKLVDNPKLIPNATEELLRYAGVVHTLYRRSTRDLLIGDIQIQQGQLVILEIDSANFDPDRFEHSERMDVTRPAAGHLGLGTGSPACVGSFLIRTACSVATPILLAARPLLAHNREVIWIGDRTTLWPRSVPIRFAASECA
ncbi:MAG: cytochrome P450 [Acidobacteriaceae bacterium]